MFTLAHLSDPHLPLSFASVGELLGKRITGFLSWKLRRRFIYLPEIRQALIQDLKSRHATHVAITGDLINISLEKEFQQALDLLKDLGPPEHVSLVPGNHDRYVSHTPGFNRWISYMQGGDFPYLRRFGDIALIGLSSAIPTAPFMATGAMGLAQQEKLDEILDRLGKENVCRVVMIHHPPFGERKFPRKALRDAPQLRDIIARRGAELVIHGHMHRTYVDYLKVPKGTCPVFGVASASAAINSRHDPAGYHLYRIEKTDNQWKIHAEIFKLTSMQPYEFASQGQLLFRVP